MTFGNGSANYLIDTSSAVAQIVGTTLKLWLGEWFLNLSAGVPWSTQVVGRNTLPVAQMVIRAAILGAAGVTSIGSLTFNLDANTRKLTVTATKVQTIFGTINELVIPVPLA